MPTPRPIRDDLPTLYAYSRWADARVIEVARVLTPTQYAAEPTPGWASIRSTLVHVAGATNIWARRLQGDSVTARPSEADYPTLDDAERFTREGYDAFDRLIGALTPERLATLWEYRDIQGVAHRTPIWSVFRHVANHATYHRGQVASKLKRFGVEPPITDLMLWALEPPAES